MKQQLAINLSFAIVNGYTQFHWEGEGVLADYDAIRSVFRQVKQQFGGKRIGYPKLGAGLARGDWSIIARIIEEELAGEDHTYVEFMSRSLAE
jgi:O-acetyl-ADP-ribose deacetylase (regulator of RNase III)